nr:SusD/RagB family nutrient-binding outer membrane lipoprotein [Fodinibius sp.]NIV15228.1 SusD/RagB family nutrient-binding outer membrane lipoprotein [Fodinibius sp.]NIY29092.1 SusD/RagB family nutrient-binding outer membrane lipoprotein [Fodinibius sp.]
MKKLILSITVIAFLVSNCEIASFDDDINNNPNLPSKAEPTQLIANAMLSLPSLSS